MNPYVAEVIGTMILVLIGNGVCANANLTRTKAHPTATWLFINIGWALAVYVAAICTQEFSGAHLNPAVSIGIVVAGADAAFGWGQAMGYIVAQTIGAMLGAGLVYAAYMQHFAITEDGDAMLGTFCTAPAIRGTGHNLFGEGIGTFVLVFAVLLSAGATLVLREGGGEMTHKIGLGSVGAMPIALVVLAIGAGLGGNTGYGINPARDFGPRLMHFLLPIPGKRDSDWGYAWIPIVGPILGGIVAAILYRLLAAPNPLTS